VTKRQLCYFVPIIAYVLYVFFIARQCTDTFFNNIASMLLFIGAIGSALAGFNGSIAIAVISGIAFSAVSAVIIIGGIYLMGICYMRICNMEICYIDVAFSIFLLIPFFIGSAILAIAFITHGNKKFSKLRAFYFIPATVLVLFLFGLAIELLFGYNNAMHLLINRSSRDYLQGYIEAHLIGEISVLSVLITIYVGVYYAALIFGPIFIRLSIAASTIVGLNSIFLNAPSSNVHKDSQGLL